MAMTDEEMSIFQKSPCETVDCPERIDCCTTVRWKIDERDYRDIRFREWWLLHEGARIYEEDGVFWIQWPMKCRNVSPDGLRCEDYDRRPATCRLYVCRWMAGMTEGR